MSAYDWIQCPKGCKTDTGEINTVRVDLDWNMDEKHAFVKLRMECQICELLCVLEQEKKPKTVIREMVYDEVDRR